MLGHVPGVAIFAVTLCVIMIRAYHGPEAVAAGALNLWTTRRDTVPPTDGERTHIHLARPHALAHRGKKLAVGMERVVFGGMMRIACAIASCRSFIAARQRCSRIYEAGGK